MSFSLHPLCTLFPRLTGAEFDALREDIKANGLRSPIVVHEGMILDGGNRYRACLEAGVEPVFAEFDGGNLVAFVLSANLHRRHMTPGQQAAIVASAKDWATAQGHGGARRGFQVATLPLETVSQRAAESGASPRTQRMADKVARADPALAVEVAHGNVSLPEALKKVEQKSSTTRATATASAVTKDQKAPGPVILTAGLDDDSDGDDAFGVDPLEELVKANATIDRLEAEIRAMQADDQKAEVLKLHRLYEAAVRSQNEAMERAAAEQKLQAFKHRQLMRCGKAVGETDPDRIAPAVEAFVRRHKEIAA